METRLLNFVDAAKALGISRPLLYKAVEAGNLTTVTIGTRRFIPMQSIHELLGNRTTGPGEAR